MEKLIMEKLIRFDWAIKHILRNKANFDILEGFLSALLREDIRIVNLLESEGNQEDEADKFNRVDLLVENQKQERLIIEVQVRSEHDYFHRIAYTTAKLLTQYRNKGQEDLRKVIVINISYFSFGHDQDYLYHGSAHFSGLHHGDELPLSAAQKTLFGIDAVSQVFPEYYLIRVDKFQDRVQDAIDEWIYMLKHSEVKPEFQSKNIQAAAEKLRVMGLEPEQRKAYDRFEENPA